MVDSRRIKIEFVNHACTVLEAGDVRLMCDPWFTGSAFFDGWDLLVPTNKDILEFAPTHIWISHEHPDHFSPRDLLAIPEKSRASITVLYQETTDGKVVGFLRSKGFQVSTLPPLVEMELAPGIAVVTGSVGADTWLNFSAFGQSVLNLNDCITGQDIEITDPRDLPAQPLQSILEVVGSPDLLLTQFSLANWAGNPADRNLHRRQAEAKLNQVRHQIRLLSPRAVAPFAGFIYFSHEENRYLNGQQNTVMDCAEVIEREGCRPVVLYPGDEYLVGESKDNQTALARWRTVYENIDQLTYRRSNSVNPKQLQAEFAAYQSRVKARNDWTAIEDYRSQGGLAAARIYLWDLDLTMSFDLVAGLTVSSVGDVQSHIQMGSASLAYLMKHDWGRGTLMVNARFSADYPQIQRFLGQTQISYGNNVGLRFPESIPVDILEASPSYVALFCRKAARMTEW